MPLTEDTYAGLTYELRHYCAGKLTCAAGHERTRASTYNRQCYVCQRERRPRETVRQAAMRARGESS